MTSNNIYIKELDVSYNDQMLEILRNSPMQTDDLDLYFDKSPDIFRINQLWSDRYKYYGIFVGEKLAGFGMHLKYSGYINGTPKEISYLGNFYIDKQFRNRGLFKELSEYILNGLYHDTAYGYCLVLEGNRAAQKYFTGRVNSLPSMPYYQKIGTYETRNVLITRKKRENPKYSIRKACEDDIPQILSMLQQERSSRVLAPVIDQKMLKKRFGKNPDSGILSYYLAFENQKMAGLCAAWEISAIKRTRILKYKRKNLLIRLIYGMLAVVFQYPDLPDTGEPLKEVYITDVAVNGNPDVFKDLLNRIYNDCLSNRYNLIYIGSYKGDPVLKATESFFSTPIYASIYFSAKDKNALEQKTLDCSKPLIDPALIG